MNPTGADAAMAHLVSSENFTDLHHVQAEADPFEAGRGQAPDLSVPVSPADEGPPTAFGTLMERAEGIAVGRQDKDASETRGVDVLGGPEGETPGLAPLDGAPIPEPSYNDLMRNYRSATTHAIEVTLVGSAGTSMAGSMSKLMSGQ